MLVPLNELIKNYKEDYVKKFEKHLEKFKEIKDYKDLIYHSVFEVGSNEEIFSQTNILRFNIANILYQCLTDDYVKEKIINSLSFSEILDVIYIISQSSIVRYFSSLNLYDCSLRIGAHYNIYPNKVYIHCGSITGAKNLFKNNYCNLVKYFNEDESFPYLCTDSLPKELQNLEPHLIEDFLCKFATRLDEISI